MIPLLFALLTSQSRLPFDGSVLKTGLFQYDVRREGKEVATGRLYIENRSAECFFSGTFTASVCQHWESTAFPGFLPQKAFLRFCKDGPDRLIFDLHYEERGRRIGGIPLPSNIVDQRVDWAAVMALPLQPGYKFEFQVYDPGTGVSPLIGQVEDGEPQTIGTPAGKFRAYALAYRMEKKGRPVERYRSFVTVDTPRMLIRIHFPDGSISSLTRYE